MAQLEPQRIYTYNNEYPCKFYMKDRDTSNKDSHGECDIDYSGTINWFMKSGNIFTFNWVSGFSDIPSYVDHSNAIGRFKHNSNSGNSYLWYFCDKSEENLRINSLTTVMAACDNLDWRFYNTQFSMMGIEPTRVFIYDQTRNCEIFMKD